MGEGGEVWFWEISVIVALFFASLGGGLFFDVVPASGFLDDWFAIFEEFGLSGDFKIDGGFDCSE